LRLLLLLLLLVLAEQVAHRTSSHQSSHAAHTSSSSSHHHAQRTGILHLGDNATTGAYAHEDHKHNANQYYLPRRQLFGHAVLFVIQKVPEMRQCDYNHSKQYDGFHLPSNDYKVKKHAMEIRLD
jgi:hypothetical protein